MMLKNHFIKILYFILLNAIVFCLVNILIFVMRYQSIEEIVNITIAKNKIRDFNYLCSIMECKYMFEYDKDSSELIKALYLDDNDNLKILPTDSIIINKSRIYENFYIDSNLNIMIFNEYSNIYFVLNESSIFKFKGIFYLVLPFQILSLYLLLYWILIREKDISLKHFSGIETLLENKSMISIAENIHHELNTPIEIIDNKIRKIKEKIYIKNNKTFNEFREDFKMIEDSSEQIYCTLSRMKEMKILRYSNGNKSLEDIIKGSFKISGINYSDVNMSIKGDFSNFYLKELRNSEFLGILLNHIKNSVEADSSEIIISLESYKNKMVTFLIVDNGTGMSSTIKKKLFTRNYSTKQTLTLDDSIRGNGMFLNKLIIKDSKGDIKLISSSNTGTIFEIQVLCQ